MKWVIAAALFGVAAFAVFIAVQNPQFWIEAGIAIATSVAVAISPFIGKMLSASPETVKRTREDSRQAIERTINGREKER